MLLNTVKVYPSKINLPKKKQLAWKIAEIASDNAKLNKHAIEMVINRIIDNASVAIASLNRKPVISSREMALKHSRKNGATLFGINKKLKLLILEPDNLHKYKKRVSGRPKTFLGAAGGCIICMYTSYYVHVHSTRT